MKKLLITALLIPSLAFAWEPTKPISVLIPTTPASGNEMAARAITSQLELAGKGKFIIENKPGADGNIMLKALLEAPADGYTVGIPSCVSTFLFTDIFFTNMIKQSPMDLTLITNIGKSPMAFVANPKSPVNNVSELIAAVKSGRNVNFAVGGTAHLLAWEYFMDKVGGNRDKVITVMYKGPNPALLDTAAGVTEFGIMPITVANTLVPSGKVKLIGIAGEHMPAGISKNVPLMNSVVPGLNVYGCWNVALPPNTPQDIVDWYVNNFIPALRTAEYKKFMEDNMIILDPRSVGQAAVRRDMVELRQQWHPYVRKLPAPN